MNTSQTSPDWSKFKLILIQLLTISSGMSQLKQAQKWSSDLVKTSLIDNDENLPENASISIKSLDKIESWNLGMSDKVRFLKADNLLLQ